jgi:hypothetical protein
VLSNLVFELEKNFRRQVKNNLGHFKICADLLSQLSHLMRFRLFQTVLDYFRKFTLMSWMILS